MRRMVWTYGTVLGLGLGLALGLLWLLGNPAAISASPGTLYVSATDPTCGGSSPCYSTIQDAVDAALAGDWVKVAQGTYSDIHVRAGITQVVYISKSLTVQGGYSTVDWDASYPVTRPTILDAQEQGRAIAVDGSGIDVVIDGLYLNGGDATGLEGSGMGYDVGGGLYSRYADTVVANCWITDNVASTGGIGWGGGLGFYGGSATLQGNVIEYNVASAAGSGYGGGAYFRFNAATIGGNTVRGNTASQTGTGYGGGLCFMFGSAALQDNAVRDNVASSAGDGYGGGVDVWSSTVSMDGDAVYGNTAFVSGQTGYGGGVNAHIGSVLTLVGVNVAGNTAQTGGGISIDECEGVTVTGSLVYSNTAAEGSGGGLSILSTAEHYDVVLADNRVSGNTARDYGGGLNAVGGSGPSLTVTMQHNHVLGNRVETGSGGGRGGGLSFIYANAILFGNQVLYNEAEASGAGVRMEATNGHLDGDIVRYNRATGASTGTGGGIYLINLASVHMTNTVIADNEAGYGAAGMGVIGSYARMVHPTLARNSGGDGSGIYVGPMPGFGPGTISVTNAIVVSHTVGVTVSGTGPPMIPLSVAEIDGVLWYGNGNDTGGGGTIAVTHPHAGDPAFFGDGVHLRPGSEAIDRGVDMGAGAPPDLDGDPRPHGLVPDLGADEWWPKAYFPIVARQGL